MTGINWWNTTADVRPDDFQHCERSRTIPSNPDFVTRNLVQRSEHRQRQSGIAPLRLK